MNTRSHHASPLPSKLKTRAKNSPLRISPPKSQISNLKLFPILTLALAATLALSTRHPTRAESQAIPDTIGKRLRRSRTSPPSPTPRKPTAPGPPAAPANPPPPP